MANSTSDFTIDEVDPDEAHDSELQPINPIPVCHDPVLSSPRLMATPQTRRIHPAMKRKTDKITPKTSD